MSRSEKAKDGATLRGLKGVAKRINAMIEKAATGETRAFDLRLSAAYHLAEARATCKEAKINFEKWCEANVSLGYKEAKRLALVGADKEPKLALEDMRAKQAARGRKHREKTKASSTPAPAGPGRVTHAAPALPPPSSYVAALDTVAALPEGEQVKVVKEAASRIGLTVATKGEAPATTVQGIVASLKKLSPSERRKVIRLLTELVEQDAAAAGVATASDEVDLREAQPETLARVKPKKKGSKAA